VRAQPLSRKWAQKVAAEIYQLRPGVDLSAYPLTDDERAVAARLDEPHSFSQLCRGSTLDPDSLRRLLRRLRGDGILRSLSGQTPAVTGSDAPEAAEPPLPGPGEYRMTTPSHAQERAGGAARPVRRATAPRASDREREPRPHEQKSGLIRRFLDSVRFGRR
jgi:hypothetical protein